MYRYGSGLEFRKQVESLRSVLPDHLAAQWVKNGDVTERRVQVDDTPGWKWSLQQREEKRRSLQQVHRVGDGLEEDDEISNGISR